MDRQTLLANWTKFPAAPAGCASLVRWERAPGWVGGKLGFSSLGEWEGGTFFLFTHQSFPANGQTGKLLAGNRLQPLSPLQPLALKWELPFLFCQSEADSGEPMAAVSLGSVFHFGDHVAVELGKQNSDGSWSVRRLMLLGPCEVDERPKLNAEWPEFLAQVRQFFVDRKFLEVQTPSLVACPGLEPSLEPFAVADRYLPTSPEIHLKKALCQGLTDIFEIKTCYRRGEISNHHQPEFHMLEWYRAYADLDLIISDLRSLLTALGSPPPQVTTFKELFALHLGVGFTPSTSAEELRGWCEKFDIETSASDSESDLFHRLWIEKVESKLEQPTIVRDFPPYQAALARIKDNGWADRFEFFWNGLEIANAFHEVNNPAEQVERWQMEIKERARLGTPPLTGDDDLIAKMKHSGLPPTGGIALGVERLFMAANGVKDIRSLRLFPYDRP